MNMLEILSQKICHDLAGKIGAITTASEVLALSKIDSHASDLAIALIRDTARDLRSLLCNCANLYSSDIGKSFFGASEIKNFLLSSSIPFGEVKSTFPDDPKELPEFLKISFCLLCVLVKPSLNPHTLISLDFSLKNLSLSFRNLAQPVKKESLDILLSEARKEVDVYNVDAYWLLSILEAENYKPSIESGPDYIDFKIEPR